MSKISELSCTWINREYKERMRKGIAGRFHDETSGALADPVQRRVGAWGGERDEQGTGAWGVCRSGATDLMEQRAR
jgi:hypothetical protein